MNYYPFHIGDFRSGSVNMTRHARWIYRDMMDVYYDAEKPLSIDLDVLCDQLGVMENGERAIVERLLRFKFIKSEDGYRHEICDQVIAEYHAKAEIAKANGKLGGRPPKAKAKQKEPSGFPSGYDPVASGVADLTGSEANQEPITKNHKPVKLKPEAATPAALPDWLPADCWTAFVEMRKAIKKPLTPGGIPLAMQKLDTLRAAGNDPRAVLEQSTLNSWQGLFEIKAQYAKHGAQSQKFNFANADRSGDQLAQAESMARHGITSIPDGDIEI